MRSIGEREALPETASLRVAATVAVLLAFAAGCAPTASTSTSALIAVSGTVRDDLVKVTAPALQRPSLDVSIGGTSAGALRAGAQRPAQPSSAPTLSAGLVSLETSEGSRVTTGQVLAVLDSRELQLGVVLARTAAARAHAQADVLDAKLADLEDTADTLASTRATVTEALSTARGGRARLVAAIAQLEAAIARLSRVPVGSIPPSLPPGPPAPRPGQDPRILLPRLQAQLRTLRGMLARVDAGLAAARSGLARIDAGEAKLADARSTLRGLRSVLREVAKAADAAVPVAQARLAQATLRSPVTGYVVETAPLGSALMVDEPVVTLRRSGHAVVDVYLTPEQAARVRVGQEARVTIDSLPGRSLKAHLVEQFAEYDYPPSSLPTTEIHMTRAFRAVVELDGPVQLPAGTPADVTLESR